MATDDVAGVIAHLEQTPVALQDAMHAAPEGVPNVGGFYAWWATQDVIEKMPERPHPRDRSLSLLYVGISPARASSGQALRGRLLGNHINGNIGSSTFRFVLASLLLSSLDLHPRRRATKVTLDEHDDARLRAWQFTNLRLTWCERERPGEIEDAVIQAMQPPLNAARNSSHPFFATVKASRAAFRAAATE